MTPEEMRSSSAAKVKQILDLMKSLHVRVEARERVTPDAFIEKTVFWIDDEQYPQPEAPAPAPTGDAAPTGESGEAPTGETAPDEGSTGASGEDAPVEETPA